MQNRMLKIIAIFLLVSTNAFAQTSKTTPNAAIQKMVKEVSAKNIEATIRKLVSFGTRNTLSEQDNPTRGIGAARDWLYAEFQKISAGCGGCLDVQKQAFVQPKANRIPEPTTTAFLMRFASRKAVTSAARSFIV